MNGLIWYDCGSPNLNVTALSLIDIEEYNIWLTESSWKPHWENIHSIITILEIRYDESNIT